jgi:O-antigen/teichoic acid export membrane protein
LTNSLKQRTVSGLTWSFIDQGAVNGIQFVVGIILSRLLTPHEFGLVGMITIFISISRSFVDSGFTQAIIRKNNATQTDYATIFYFNILISVIVYFILFFSSPAIGAFFEEPKLVLILKILSLTLLFDAFAIVQRARLTKRIDFKLQTKISIIASVSSGIIGILMAYEGFGVWSLVAKILSRHALISIFLCIWNRWIPTLEFSIKAFKDMFSFGSKLLLSGLINTAYRNVYKLIIGKFFSAADLGYFTRAEQFKNLPSQNLTTVIQRVSYPVLSTLQNDMQKLKQSYRKLIRSTMLITFVLMLSLAAIARPLIITLIGDHWLPSVIFLQLLCFEGIIYPLSAINQNMLKVQGRSDLYLKLEIIKKILAIPVIVIGIFISIEAIIIGMIINSFIAYILNSYYSGKMIGYSNYDQLKDILPSFLLGLSIGLVLLLLDCFIPLPVSLILIMQITSGIILFIFLSELFKMKDYKYIKDSVVEKLRSIIIGRKS